MRQTRWALLPGNGLTIVLIKKPSQQLILRQSEDHEYFRNFPSQVSESNYLTRNSFTLSEVCLGISSQVKYTMQAFWAVSIRELHISLWRPWSELQLESITTERSIVDNSHYQHLAVDIR